jgi:hypothetical protein
VEALDVRVGNVVWVVDAVGEGMGVVAVVGAIGITGLVPVGLSSAIIGRGRADVHVGKLPYHNFQ